MKKLLLILLCLMLAGASLLACSNTSPKELRIFTTPLQEFTVGDTEEFFNETLKSGSVKIRYKNNTDSDTILMSDEERITVSGFNSETPGYKIITVMHKKSSLKKTYTIQVKGEEPKSFKITEMPTLTTYNSDVTVQDIDLTGGEYEVTYNTNRIEANMQMTSDSFTVLSLEKKSNSATVVLRLTGTILIEKFEILLITQ